MNYKVLKSYIDKDTLKKHMVGDVVEVSDERFERINSTSHGAFLEPLEEVKAVEVANETKVTPKKGSKTKKVHDE